MAIAEIPEIAGLDARRGLVRIPPELDVPLTPRVRRLIDTSPFRRLRGISQLGLVSLVYPAATHSRFEHSLGVYRLALVYLKQLAQDERFAAAIDEEAAELLIVAALLHDLGHWPFCHPIEDIRLPGVPHHERFAKHFLLAGEIAEALEADWRVVPSDVVALLSEKPATPKGRILASILSGPIDVDKTDYLMRDSLHAGVPYGRNFDQGRLIGSLCLNEEGNALAISEKGKTAAEMLVFARYVMFSEVYWHHGVRSATAMLQRAFYLLRDFLDLDRLFRQTEAPFVEQLLEAAGDGPGHVLIDGLFGPRRRLYKRVAQYSFFEDRGLYERLARRPYPWLVACAERFAEAAAAAIGQSVAPHEILFDAPPVTREVEFNIDVYFIKEHRYRPLGAVSPVVRTLAERQFDDYVKRVRIFAHPRIAGELRNLESLPRLLEGAIESNPGAA
ncbi:MAG TPA: HD domain-containing protein [Pirellulales bacterium]|nr:HD domain-containing protein [Pirellulales bacterium]